jgi:hypothetical protein
MEFEVLGEVDEVADLLRGRKNEEERKNEVESDRAAMLVRRQLPARVHVCVKWTPSLRQSREGTVAVRWISRDERVSFE